MQAQKAEIEARKLQSRIGRLDQVRVEDDATGLFAPISRDLFDDVTSPQAQAYVDQRVAQMRAAVEAGEEGVSDVLDEVDDLDTMLREFTACLTGKVTE